jgi:site-specific DNA-methyltransferase (adenine-specific)
MSLPKPYYQDDYVTLYQADCRDILPYLSQVNLIVTDPPYKLNNTTGTAGVVAKFACKWQGLLKVADVSANIVNEIAFDKWLPLIAKSLANPSHCYIFCNDKNLERLLNICKEEKLHLHNVLFWLKNNATPNRWYMKQGEFVIFLHKGKSFPINNLGSKTALKYLSVQQKCHPTEKPVSLLKHLIENSSQKNDVVLDPFAGSGSTLLAARALNRKSIGIEIDKKYCDLIVKRLNQKELSFG